MKGLLLKDFYMTKSYLRTFLILMILFLGIGAIVPGNSFFMLYPAMFAGIIPISMITYDETFKWDVYSLTMPVSKSEIVRSKYLYAAICLSIVIAITAIVIFIKQSTGTLEQNTGLSLFTITVMVGMLVPIIELPLVFKFGVAKSRFVYLILIGGIAGLSAVLGTDQDGSKLANWDLPVVILLAATIVLFIVSMKLSEKIYEKREL